MEGNKGKLAKPSSTLAVSLSFGDMLCDLGVFCRATWWGRLAVVVTCTVMALSLPVVKLEIWADADRVSRMAGLPGIRRRDKAWRSFVRRCEVCCRIWARLGLVANPGFRPSWAGRLGTSWFARGGMPQTNLHRKVFFVLWKVFWVISEIFFEFRAFSLFLIWIKSATITKVRVVPKPHLSA